ncbi:uncharacterized protein PHACADRAFT_183284 [Phanerochaete carnosa HHB-10118-sp]|uniref:non-specific serine/threonine protein kinase n=1 Tax=Phanerochaete carnosa (strain HHB-10118-sp) TaxID=650164 RepID=K5VYL7_PHACS|nr:uncharacterized protein PHACADRAFT_183284 [Phanerochaete carnosa HHB-10118-sp]EKM56683.1 hypothetical protein PHACADRAFT_183284 [Phanerochaete carnosa HHB-10118-sp]
MGHAQSLIRTSGALDSFVAELGPDVIYERSMGSARFLKTVKCRHKNGYLVVKIFIKPDPGLSLRKYHRRLKVERDALADIPNVYTYQSFVETDKAGYLIRQWVASSLYDRISTRPFLSHIEKKWLAYQLLTALRDARNRKVSHGDLKTSNILITSWNWLLVSDFAPHKPAYLPLDDPADFSFFFDTSGRRTCYIAPERFYSAEENPEASRRREKEREGEGKREGRVTEAMDCFSAGCVLAELFLEGTPLFSLSQLFKYRAGELNVDAQLAAIDDEGVRDLTKSMIAIDPSQRPTFDSLLHNARGTVFPEMFYSFLHNYVASVNELSSPSPFSFPNHSHPSTTAPTPTNTTPTTAKPPVLPNAAHPVLSGDGDRLTDQLPSDSDHRMERLWSDYESVEPYLLPAVELGDLADTVKDPVRIEFATPNVVGKPVQDIFPVELEVPNRDSKLLKGYGDGRKAAKEAVSDGPALILLALLTANIRNCNLPSSKLKALDVCLALAPLLTDEAKLDRMVPSIVELLLDDAPAVRAAAIRTLMQILMLVTVITPSNASIFPEYIIPALSPLVRDPEVSVRCMYAQCVVALADTAVRYLEMGQALRAHGAYKIGATAALTEGQDYDEAHFEVSYDASMQELQNAVQEQLSALLVDPSPVVKRSILHNISALCIFLGKQRTNDVLLSHMITYLNDRDWLLRYAFFDSIVEVAACAGGRSLEDYILPLMIQALSDIEETVVARVLASLRSLCELGLFQKMRIWELLSATLAFLFHPNIWIRQGAAAFIAAAAKHLPPSDVWCILYPSLKHFLRSDIQDVDERSLLLALKPPLSRHIFDAAKSWAKAADKSVFWRTQRAARSDSPKDSLASVKPNAASRSKSEEDDAQMTKLQQLGMTTADEGKLHAMRDFVSKLARNIASFETRVRVEPEVEGLKVSSTIELQKLGVVPQTVFLKAPSDNATAMRSAKPMLAQRAISDAVRSPVLSGTPRSNRTMSADFNLGAPGTPFEDLRRRLAIINGSTTSLSVPPTARDVRSPTAPVAESLSPTSSNTAVSDVPLERPSSPTDSVTSGANSSFRTHRLQIGSTDGQKAPPAVGSSKANATGLLESLSKLRDGSPERSGRSSPVSVAGTIRGERPRISTSVPISTYDGQEPGISNLLEHMYLENNRDLHADFGPRVHEGPVRRRNAARHSYMPRDGSNRRLETALIANLSSHTDAVTGLSVSPDHMFFVSASDDKTVKVWDTARLERNVTSKPRHTYNQHHARVKAICFVEATHCFVSAAEDGSVHVVRVHVSGNQGPGAGLPKYGKLQTIREYRLDVPGQYVTCMAHYNTATASNLLFGTTHSVITILDLRTTRVLRTMENPRHYGPITCLCLDRKRTWVVCGTSTGVLSLWDLRFGILIKSWETGAAARGMSACIHQCVVHPTKGKGRWVVVALEGAKSARSVGAGGTVPEVTTLVEVWDIEKSALVETFVTRSAPVPSALMPQPQEVTAQSAEASPAAAIAALVRARQDGTSAPADFVSSRRRGSGAAPIPMPVEAPSPDVHALVLGSEFGGHGALYRSPMAELDNGSLGRGAGRGFMLCGSEDRRIRLWDLEKTERSAVLSGPDAESEKPVYSAVQSDGGSALAYVETWVSSPSASQASRPPQRLSLINHSQQNLLKAHQDTINALVCIDSPFRGGIVSGDRAGIIKVWRVESAE